MYIVPPKLQTKLLIGGLTIPEALVALGSIVFLVYLQLFDLLVLPAGFIFVSWRVQDNRNITRYFKIVLRYLRTPQHYTRRLSKNG